jgi:hypothetical protein
MRLIKHTGEVVEDYQADTLEQKQNAVGGYIQYIRISDTKVMIVNEEGVLYSLPHNERASELAGQYIVGDVLVADQYELL